MRCAVSVLTPSAHLQLRDPTQSAHLTRHAQLLHLCHGIHNVRSGVQYEGPQEQKRYWLTLTIFWPPEGIRQHVGLHGVQLAQNLDDIIYHEEGVIISIQDPLVAVIACTFETCTTLSVSVVSISDR